jgi:predicted dehydrogenase
MMSQPIRLGVIGLGNIGQQHIKHINNSVSDCELTAICSRNKPDNCNDFGTSNVQHFTDFRALVDSGIVDGVIIATPTKAHLEQGKYALTKGLHVLMEKPIGLSCLEGEHLNSLVKNEQVFSLMLNQRTDPLFTKMKAIVSAGQLGNIQRVNWTMTNWFRPEVYFQVSDWRATWAGEGGGLLVNQCIHNLDILQWICGMPISVQGNCSFGKYHNIEVEDEASAFMQFESGATGQFSGSSGEYPGVNRFDIVGDLGTLSFDGDALTWLKTGESVAAFCKKTNEMFGTPPLIKEDITPQRDVNQHALIIQNFVNSIKHQEPLIAPASEGLRSLALANGILLSAWTQKVVNYPLDSNVYQAALQEKIAQSIPREKQDIEVSVDMDKSYR